MEFINNVSYLEDESQMITVNATDVDSNDLFYNCNSTKNINCSVNENNITFTSPQNFNGTESLIFPYQISRADQITRLSKLVLLVVTIIQF